MDIEFAENPPFETAETAETGSAREKAHAFISANKIRERDRESCRERRAEGHGRGARGEGRGGKEREKGEGCRRKSDAMCHVGPK